MSNLETSSLLCSQSFYGVDMCDSMLVTAYLVIVASGHLGLLVVSSSSTVNGNGAFHSRLQVSANTVSNVCRQFEAVDDNKWK